MSEEWYTLDDIQLSNDESTLYCLAVSSPTRQFLVGEIGVPTHNTDEGKAEDALRGEATMILGSIARLGRASGVHEVLATQRPDATILPGEVKANLAVRINCGRTDTNASSMILGSGEGTRIKSSPPGRLYIQSHGSANGVHAQGFFAEQEWIDEWLEKQGKNPDGSLIAGHGHGSHEAHKPVRDNEDEDTSEMIAYDEEEDDNENGTGGGLSYNDDEEDDGTFQFTTDDDEDDSSSGNERSAPSAPAPRNDGWESLDLQPKKADEKQFSRPEESWDSGMDDIISMNEM